jgi:dihydrodipicolinate synthase/N-acetylneuraminate lyase
MLVAPPWAVGNFAAALEMWTAIGANCNLPFYVYWIAATADRTITPERVRLPSWLSAHPIQFVEAARKIPTFRGIKFTDTDFFKFQQLLDLGVGNAVTGPDEMMVRRIAPYE